MEEYYDQSQGRERERQEVDALSSQNSFFIFLVITGKNLPHPKSPADM